MTYYYRCPTCSWITETKKRPRTCDRCLAQPVQKLSASEFIATLDTHESRYCEACKTVHLR